MSRRCRPNGYDSRQHAALAACNFDTIYTTNFEHHIEEALRDSGRPARALARLGDFMDPCPRDTCRVIKFHGDIGAPETIVLTEAQFFDRFRLEAAPDQCLRADMLSKSFLFLGYSFSDVNIRYIWYRMDQMRRQGVGSGPVAPHMRCYWATFGAGLVQPQLLDQWHIDMITLDPNDKEGSVVELLNTLNTSP